MSPTAGTDDPRGGFSRGLDRIFRTSLILVPVGLLGNLAFAWYFTDRSYLSRIGELDRRYLYLAGLLALIPWFTNAIRLLVWTRFIGHRVSFRDTFRITLGAEVASSVFPTSSGGEVFRWGMMVQRGISKGEAASIVSLGYLEDLLFFATALPLAAYFSRAWQLPVFRLGGTGLKGDAAVTGGIILGLLAALGILWRLILQGMFGQKARRFGVERTARTRRRLRKTGRDFRQVWKMVVARGKARFALTFLVTAIQWSSRYSVATAVAYFLGAQVDPLLFFLLQWVIFTAMMFVPTPGASGGAEGAFAAVYSALLPPNTVGLATALWRMLTFYFLLSVGSIIFTLFNIADARTRARRRAAEGSA
jgi:glycosyltransferase 2 family protein